MTEKLYTRYHTDEIDTGKNVAILGRRVETLVELKEGYIDFVAENDHDGDLFETDEEFNEWADRVRSADMEELRFIMEGFASDLVEVDSDGNGYVD